jgi:acyl-CoA synthetase (AMP-forming)/AMP-acid ligase II
MPLHFATEPKNGTALVQKALSKLATRPSPLSERAVDFNALQVQQPHAVYDLRADAIAHGDGLASAKASGFRYLIGTGGTTVAAAEVLADANGNATLLANVNHGPYVEATARALAQVATLSAVGAGSYEVRLLRFSAIGLMALWLKPDAGGADIIYPLAPAPDGLQAERAYSADEFLQAIVPLAQKRVGASGKLP